MNAGRLIVDAAFEARVKRDEPMSRHTSWHVGGPADLYFSPRDRTDLLAFLGSVARGHAAVLARASAAICWCAMAASAAWSSTRRRASRGSSGSTTPCCTCEAGVPCARLARQCIKWGLGPAEFLAGIPGTLGGALAMNAGAFGGETWPRVRSVDVCDARGNATPPRRARIPVWLPAHRAAGAGRVLPGRGARVRARAPASPRRRCASCSPSARKPSPSVSGAADPRSPIRPAITPRGSSKRRGSRDTASETSWFLPNTPTSW